VLKSSTSKLTLIYQQLNLWKKRASGEPPSQLHRGAEADQQPVPCAGERDLWKAVELTKSLKKMGNNGVEIRVLLTKILDLSN
jgi:hypothetical protein